MTWKKRIISIVLCLCALLCAASVRAEAEDAATTHTDHPICGAKHKDIGNHTSSTCSSQTWTAWNGGDITYDTNNVAYIYLSDDVTLTQIDSWGYALPLEVKSGNTLYLCLNGHSLKSKAYNTISVSGTLVLCDCNGSGQGEGAISHGEEDGSICGAEGIYVIDNAIFTMYGGTISDNASRGVLVSGGTFTMYGGEISHNKCITTGAEGGGGVWVKNDGSSIGNFAMYGGKISNNTYKGTGNCGGGGVYASGTGDFIIQGGEITNNQCSYNATNTSATTSGGGLYISGKPGKLKIENCTISNNTCDGEGGGIFIISNETGSITNCTISNNSATGASSKGGGLAFDTATVTITGGSITDNKTAGKGGAMAVGSWGEDSKITLSSGLEFSGNAQGCTADKNGKLIGGTANDVYLNSSAYLRLADDFSKTSTDPIVVTTASEPNSRSTVKIAEGSASAAKATDFTYGTDSNSTIGIIAKTKADGTTVELLACKHNYSTQKDETNHWQECSICGDKKDEAKHTYSNTWKKNSTQHWHECECGAKNGEADHAYSNEWKTGDGKHWHECECGQKSGEAAHSYSTAWDRDNTSHFHKCSACGDKTDIAICVYTARVTSGHQKSDATCTAKAVYWKSCVCDRESTETFEYGETNPNNHTGQLGDWQTNTDEHWKVYSCCQAQSDKAAHAWDEGEVTTPATCTAAGVKTYTCTACSATKKETIPATGHAWDTEWSKDNDHHWHECNNANCTEIADQAEHSWNEGEVTTSPTCTTVGEKTYTCGTCNAKKTEEIPASGHDFSVRRYDENNHWLKCSRCDATDKKEAHSGGTASCTAKAKCSVCGQEYGGLKAHDFANGPYRYDGQQHWKKCANCDATNTKVDHSGGTATCTKKAECEVCGQEHGEKLAHSYTVLVYNETQHWYKCANCDTTNTKVDHSGGTASCTKKAECSVCGQEYGGLKAHDFENGPYQYDGQQHWKKCADCDATDTKVNHSGGTASCTEKAKCEVCGQPHGDLKAHDFANGPYQYDGEQHWKKCANCDAIDTKVDHTGGTASCTAKAKCSVCGQEYGGLKAHDFANGPYQYDGEQHWKKCANCDATDTKEAHSGGKASCTEKAKCSVCGQEYGGLKAHDFANGPYQYDGEQHWKKCANCDAIDTKVDHTGGKASCTAKAKCSVCGQEYGGLKAHDFANGPYQYDGEQHWKKCANCDATDTKEAHSGGEATCTQKAVCEKCGQKYGDLKAHDFANGPYRYDGEQHWKKCANCDATDTKEAHSGGEATCTQKAVCEVCGQPHGGLKAHNFANGPYRYDGEQHWKKCANCETTDTKYDHNLVHHDAQAPTPTEKGWYAYDACSDCDYTTKKEIPATCSNHYWKLVPEVSPTCITEGVSAHFECDNCPNKSVKDGVYDIVSDTELILAINPANHTGAPDSKWHSDSANHWQEYTCCYARANEAAHSGGAVTCTAQAVCQVCGKAYGPLAAHAWQPATCTAPKTCTACHVTDGAALGHDWGAWKVTTPATKDAPGVETRTCTHNSAHTETRSIPKLSTTVYTVSEDTKIAQIEAKVDGLDKILELNENKALVNDGKSVGVSLTVKNTASSGVSEKIKEKLAGSNLVGLRLELTVEKTVTANGVVESKQTIPDAGVLLKTTITLPAELQGKSGYVVYRLHDENVHVLTETANENGEFISVSADKTQITICARLYSEYVIAYQTGGSSGGGHHPVNPTPVKATSANTGDAGVLLYGVTAALSLTGTAWLGAKSRKH